MDEEIKRWTAKRKIESWVEDGRKGMENALKANPQDVRGKKKIAVPAGRGREVIEMIRQGLQADGITVSISKLCRWFDVARRTMYYRPVKAVPKLQERLLAPIKVGAD